jgi:hypothetical protein
VFGNMGFELVCSMGHKSDRILDPFFEDVVRALGTILPLKYYFVILADSAHKGGNVFVQTMLAYEDEKIELLYLVETRFETKDSEGNKEWAQYERYMDSKEAVIQVFSDYYSGKVIDVSDWTNINEALEKEEENRKNKVKKEA